MARSTIDRTDYHNGQSAEEKTGQNFVRRGDLDLDAGMEHQKRLRTFQRVAWGSPLSVGPVSPSARLSISSVCLCQ